VNKQNCQRTKSKNLRTKKENISVKLSVLSDFTGSIRCRCLTFGRLHSLIRWWAWQLAGPNFNFYCIFIC